MPLVTTTEMFKKAYDGGYAVGAFNVNNMEIVQGITEACQEQHAPVVLQVSKGARAYATLPRWVEAAVIECPDIPIALHRTTARTRDLQACIDGGFSPDSTAPPVVRRGVEKKVVEYAHAPALLSRLTRHLAGVEDDVKVSAEFLYTHPEG
ncbi:MAG: class II fructose-bisphosphate aldolase [Butyricicoccus sp.]